MPRELGDVLDYFLPTARTAARATPEPAQLAPVAEDDVLLLRREPDRDVDRLRLAKL